MQTVEFNQRLANILKSLHLDELLVQLDLILNKNPVNVTPPHSQIRARFPEIIFQTKANLHSLASDPFNKQIIDSLGLNQIFESIPLSQMITAVNSLPDTYAIRQNTSYYHVFCSLFMALNSLQRFQQTVQKFMIQPNIEVVAEGEAALEFEIVDVGNRGIDMERFEAVIKSIHSLHDTMARALEINGRLAIAYLDSGSNSIICIKSDHRIIDSIKKLVIEVWDKIRFGKYDAMHRKLEAAEAGIKFIELVDEKEKSGKMNPEAAAQLKHLAISETVNLFGKATSLREIQTQTTLDNRSLLLDKFDIKQIEAGTSSTETSPQETA